MAALGLNRSMAQKPYPERGNGTHAMLHTLLIPSPRYLARAFDMHKNPAGGQGAANFTGGIDSDCGSLLGRDFFDDRGLKQIAMANGNASL